VAAAASALHFRSSETPAEEMRSSGGGGGGVTEFDARTLLGDATQLATLSDAWARDGCVVLRHLFPPEHASRLLHISNRVKEQWQAFPLTDNPPAGDLSNYMRHVNHLEYHRDAPEDCWALLDACADPVALATVGAALDEPFVFNQMSLYFNPSGPSEDGFWHKDQVKAAPIHDWPDPRDTNRGIVAHLQVALVESHDLEVVPGSHRRDFSAAEHEICRSYPNGPNMRSNDMPGACRAELSPGDAVMFNSITIHRGRYHRDKLRRTLMCDFSKVRYAREILERGGLNQYSDQPWFLHPRYLAGVAPATQHFFAGASDSFVQLYGECTRIPARYGSTAHLSIISVEGTIN
jgi:hypothetical protein